MDTLTEACEAALWGEAAQSLLPASDQQAQSAARVLLSQPERVRQVSWTVTLFPI